MVVERVSGVSASLQVPAPRFAQGGGLEALLSKAEAAVFERPAQAAGVLLILSMLGLLGRKGLSSSPGYLGGCWRPECFLPGGGGPPALGRTALGGPGKFHFPSLGSSVPILEGIYIYIYFSNLFIF